MSNFITCSSHGPGPTCLAFSKDGSRAFTGGQDCIVRIWKTDEGADQEPQAAVEADGAITSISVGDDCWVSSSDDFEVRRYLKDSNKFAAPITSAIGVPVRSVAIDSKGKRIAVASDELIVKVVDMEDILKVSRLECGSNVRKVSWDPSGSLLTTSTSNGKILVWDMTGDEPHIENTIDGIIPSISDPESPEFAHDCSAVWHTSGQYFFVASKGHDLITISKTDWAKSATFSDKEATGAVTAIALSPNGVYVASASQSRVHIWSTQTRRIVASHAGTAGTTITQLAFSPNNNLVAWTDTDGVFNRWVKAVPDNFPDPVRVTLPTRAAVAGPIKHTDVDLFGGDPAPTAGELGDDMADIDLDEAMADVDDDWIVDDLGGGAFRDEPKAANGLVKEMVSITRAQPPFQPTSTPMENKKRYLAYNLIGVIEVTDQDTHHIVNVEFFDRSLRKGFHFTDHFKYDIGYLGERGALFACSPENDHPAQVLFKPYSSWVVQREWTYPLKRKGSRVLGVTVGGLPPAKNGDDDLEGFGHVVVATSESDLTFLSGTGRERRIIGLGADFVSMVASAEWVFVVHRAGSTTIDGSQNLSYSIINFEDFSVRQRDVLPLPKGHTLKWIGVSDQGAPAMYDSAGWVHVLTKYRIPHHASWARVMDTNLLERRKGKDESYWPIGISENNFMCLILKGRQEHPGFPRPLIQELPIELPFRREEPKEEQVEREMLFLQIALDSLDDELTTDEIVARERAMDKEFVILIQAACKADNIPRAIELTKLLHHTTSYDLVGKIAEFYHLVGFKEKVEHLKVDREEAEDRMVAARNKRRRWLKPDPPLRQISNANTPTSSRLDPLGDTRPPPSIERPGMARVTVPVIEKTRYSSVAQIPETSTTSNWVDESLVDSPPSSESKRKRTEDNDSMSTVDFSMPPPKQKANPFARKIVQNEIRNPFARKPDTNRTIQKSESFFEKVDAAETDVGKPSKRAAKGKEKEKEREKKGGPQQTTLFGMMPKANTTKKARSKPSDDEPPLQDLSSQVTDVDMSDVTMVETQDVGGGYTQELDNWKDSSSTNETQQSLEETQIVDDP